jgi:hypothetical protein
LDVFLKPTGVSHPDRTFVTRQYLFRRREHVTTV